MKIIKIAGTIEEFLNRKIVERIIKFKNEKLTS